MPSSGKPGAVSDYEHLNSQHFLQNSKHLFRADDSGDSDFLPLKPSKLINKERSVQGSAKEGQPGDLNTNNATASAVRAKDKIGLTQMLDDFGHLQTMNMVPVPSAWSPGIIHAPNPALFITPEKAPKGTSSVGKENLSDLQTSSKVPVPVAWSPGMVLKPNPALMVTPDKTSVKKTAKSTGLFIGEEDTVAMKNRERPTVRFDLPSASSGEETLDTSQDFFQTVSAKSPITLKGCELEGDSEPVSPPWKAFSPQKAYNPSAYSDESALEDSIHSPSEPNHPGQHINTAQSAKDIEDSTSDRLADKLQELLLSSASKTNPLGLQSSDMSQHGTNQSEFEVQTLAGSSKSKSSSCPSRKVMSAVSIPRHPKPPGAGRTKRARDVQETSAPSAGPEFLKTPPSAYEPKAAELPQAQVLREWDSSPERNNYSFPFVSEGASGMDSGSEHAFARPEYNSTLRVRSELDDLCGKEIDVERAVASALTKSENKRTEMSEKVTPKARKMTLFQILY